MLRRVKHIEYELLKMLYCITIIKADDTEALVIIRKRR